MTDETAPTVPAPTVPAQTAPAPEARALRREALRGHAAMLGFALAVSGSFSLGKLAAAEIAPEALTVARFVVAALALSAVALPRVRGAHLVAPWRYALIGGLFAGYFVLMFEALRLTEPVPVAAVFTLTPLFSAGLGWLLMRQRTSARAGLALATGAVGALWVIFRGDLDRALALAVGRGEALFLIGVAMHGAYAPLVRRLNRGEPAAVFALLSFAGAIAVTLGWGGRAVLATDWAGLSAGLWGIVLYLGLVATAATFLAVRYASLRLPAGKVMAYGYLVPAFVMLWEGVSGGGWPGPGTLAGVGLIALALGVLIVEVDAPDGRPPTASPRR